MGNRPDNIRNEGAYFYTVVKNMDLKDNIKQSKIYKHKISIEEAVYDKKPDISDVDKQLSETDSIEWIEFIENEDLRNATCKLNTDEKILLHYVFYEEKTQSEIAEIYSIAQQNVSKRISKLLKKIKIFLSNK